MIELALSLLLSVFMTLTDPANDAFGDGSLTAPSAVEYHAIGELDVTEVELFEDSLSFDIRFGSLSNPYNLPNGFSLPIIEIYLEETGYEGGSTLLPGSNMSLARGASWRYAVRVNGDTATMYEAEGDTVREITSRYPLKVSAEAGTLTVESDLPLPTDYKLYGVVGNYAPFSENGWRKLSSLPSAWAYSSQEQTRPVVEVIAPTVEAQQRAIREGVLPTMGQVTSRAKLPWLLLMLGGLTMASTGVIARFFPKKQGALASEPSGAQKGEESSLPAPPQVTNEPSPLFEEALLIDIRGGKSEEVTVESTAPENLGGNAETLTEETSEGIKADPLDVQATLEEDSALTTEPETIKEDYETAEPESELSGQATTEVENEDDKPRDEAVVSSDQVIEILDQVIEIEDDSNPEPSDEPESYSLKQSPTLKTPPRPQTKDEKFEEWLVSWKDDNS